MKKKYIVWIVIAAIALELIIAIPYAIFLGATIFDGSIGNDAEIEINSYRLCKDKDGEDVIIIKYLLKNEGIESTTLYSEGEFYVYQNGVSLSEYIEELPKECNYDGEDQYRYVKGGVKYYAEIAYWLDDPEADVEVEVEDYSFFGNTKEKVFGIK